MYVATLPCETLLSENKRLTINCKVVQLHCYGMAGLLITKLRIVYSWACQWFFFKSVNIWQSYKQESGCIVHFARAWPPHCWKTKKVNETTTLLLVTLPNIHKFKKIFTDRLSNKPFLIWLLTTPPHLKHVATLPCNLSLMACILTIKFHKVVWQHMQGVVGFLITTLLQMY